MIIPRNHQKPAVHAVSCSGQSVLTPGDLGDVPREMDQKPGHYSGQHGPVPSADGRGTGKNTVKGNA